jgi:hypothetical protein
MNFLNRIRTCLKKEGGDYDRDKYQCFEYEDDRDPGRFLLACFFHNPVFPTTKILQFPHCVLKSGKGWEVDLTNSFVTFTLL